MSKKPWYGEGLRFQCTECGDCCTGAPGYVWLNKAEIEAMAAALELEVPAFEEQYVCLVGIRKSLLERPDGDCILFDGQTRRCEVYHVRPRQCRTWPFWQSNVRTPAAWAEARQACPGCGRGRLVPPDEIERIVAIIKV
ncbi:MAG: YkgJ family cysteine cluster protein [Planctomycetes bacterium]|nr:YkgJ family cysteine cluster protein [Planctomycetota bacterium]